MKENPFEQIDQRLANIEKLLKEKQDAATGPAPQDELLTREATAKLLDISPPTLWKWTKRGDLKAYYKGNKVYYKRSEVIASLTEINKGKLKAA